MFTHVFLGSNDIEKSREFYDATMSVLGYQNVAPVEAGRLIYAGPQGTFIVAPPYNGEAATVSNGHTLGFSAPDDETIVKWHQAGLAAGGVDEGAPGPRAAAPNNSHGAYLRDPDGNKVCVFHMRH
ncbi:VOC family protein [Croceibacterium sp. LX-88]|uniref:VOC family protein n=1 Tax=Croceibacterium selenioxidans TaxID=2838833 RepID=A0ABS5W5F6_9SPHN|nr:VOC family protein [Croceibacterium selenioxidans]MBT2134914.1 VOC family protein [Croceibacterium selenioxidans]